MTQPKANSWVPAEGLVDQWQGRFSLAESNEKFGLRVFLIVAITLFLLLIVSYTVRMDLGDWRPLPDPNLLWVNTAMLVLSSFGLQWAKVSADQNALKGVKFGLLSGGGFALAFLAGQAVVWKQLHSMGFFLDSNPANSFFYLITALHGIHLFGGLVAWIKTSSKVLRKYEVTKIRLSIELLTIYWHFLLVVWLVLFAMMLLT